MSDAVRLASTLALNAAWQLPALVAAAALADLLLRRRAPARARHALWRAALVLAVVLPLVTLLPRAESPERPRAALPGVPSVASTAPVPSGAVGGAARLTIPVSGLAGLAALAVFVLAGSLRGTGLALALRRARRWRSGAREEGSPRVRALARECGEALGVRGVPVLAAPGLEGPVTVGVLAPVVLLPASFAEGHDDDAIRAALAHELAHVRRRDFAANLAHEAALVPFAWHPAVRHLRRRLDETREMACDELAAASLLGPKRYARSLVAVAAGIRSLAPSPGLGVNDADILEERVRHLLRPAGASGRRGPGFAAALALLLASSLVASLAVVEAKPLPAGAPAEWRLQMKHAALAVVLALGLPANGDDLTKGLEALKAGDLKVAAASVERAIAANPKDRDALYTLGVVRWQSTYNALQEMKKAGGLEPAARDALRKDVASGHDALGKAIAVDPAFFEAYAYDNLLYRLDAELATDPAEVKAYVAKAEARLAKAKELRGASGSPPAPKTGAALPPPPPAKKTALPPPPPPPPPPPSAR